jgi:hypothetical protein
MVAWLAQCAPAAAQEPLRLYAGVLAGVSALSADAAAEVDPPMGRLSSYAPSNGLAVDAFLGWHVGNYFSVQLNYVGNRNDLVLAAVSTAGDGGAYEQQRTSRQHAFVADGLIYFRNLSSRVRPYLGTGLAIVRFASDPVETSAVGLDPPEGRIGATRPALRSHVGIDLAFGRRLRARYSFSETIGPNPVGPRLSPPGRRALLNFQNLFGLLVTF